MQLIVSALSTTCSRMTLTLRSRGRLHASDDGESFRTAEWLPWKLTVNAECSTTAPAFMNETATLLSSHKRSINDAKSISKNFDVGLNILSVLHINWATLYQPAIRPSSGDGDRDQDYFLVTEVGRFFSLQSPFLRMYARTLRVSCDILYLNVIPSSATFEYSKLLRELCAPCQKRRTGVP